MNEIGNTASGIRMLQNALLMFHETWYCQISLIGLVNIWHCVIWYHLDVLPMLPILCLNVASMQIQARSIFFKIWLPNNTFDDDKRNLRSTPSKLPLTLFFTIRFFEIDALNSFMNKKCYLTTKNGAWNKGGTFSYHIWNIIIMLITWNSNLHTFFKLIGTDRHLPWNVISVWCFDQTLCLVDCYEK